MSAEPSIITRKLRPQDLFLIFASDGLWEQLSDEDAVEIVHKNPRNVNNLLSSFHHVFFFLNREYLYEVIMFFDICFRG